MRFILDSIELIVLIATLYGLHSFECSAEDRKHAKLESCVEHRLVEINPVQNKNLKPEKNGVSYLYPKFRNEKDKETPYGKK